MVTLVGCLVIPCDGANSIQNILPLSPKSWMSLVIQRVKTWSLRAVGLGKLKKSSSVMEMESCSKFTDEWRKYWTIGLATHPSGTVMKVAQGVSQSEENTDALLDGNWGSRVNCIEILQGIELKCFEIEPSSKSSLYNFATLTAVKEILNKSMILLKLAKSSDTGTYTSNGFMDRIISLERRSRALPKGSVARQNAREELVYRPSKMVSMSLGSDG